MFFGEDCNAICDSNPQASFETILSVLSRAALLTALLPPLLPHHFGAAGA